MSSKISAPRGTKDVLPSEVYKWHYVESKAKETARLFGYNEIRFPTFEHTELFLRGVGDTTDIVQKEMYTFEDKGGRSITLRPEGTASAVRAMIEGSVLKEGLPVKAYYIAPNFRYEKPQAGRLREHHQFGVECFGSAEPEADVEVIALGDSYIKSLGAMSARLHLNTIGCPECRSEYNKELVAYFEKHIDRLCDTCRDRLKRNPMRILDCKSEVCSEIAKGAPGIFDYLCKPCEEHFDRVKAGLDAIGIAYIIDSSMVRGFDYYTRTVFEFITDKIGAQATVLGGGRYDGLVSELGGEKTPGLGFGSGIERMLLLLEAEGVDIPKSDITELVIAAADDSAREMLLPLVSGIRKGGVSVEMDLMSRGLKAQLKYANRIGAKYTITLGGDELASGRCKVRDMLGHGEEECALTAEAIAALIKAKEMK